MAIDDARCGTGRAAFRFTRTYGQQLVDGLPQAAVPPSVEGALPRGPRRTILGKHPPLAPAGRDRLLPSCVGSRRSATCECIRTERSQTRSSTRFTCTADHAPSRAVGMLRWFSLAAICRSEHAPAGRPHFLLALPLNPLASQHQILVWCCDARGVVR